jgi:3-oxoacyl-[acyl-carrier-protein] synthase II
MGERCRVVVTGMGLITSLGETVDSFWNNLIACQSGVATITRFDTSGFEVHFGGECRDFDPDKYLDRKLAKRLDRFAQMALAAAQEAVRTCGIDFKNFVGDRRRLGVILGSGIGGLTEFEEQHLRLVERGPSKVSAFTIPKLMLNAASGQLAIEHGIQGVTASVATACASAAHAMGDALQAIRSGACDVVLAGGSEAALTPLGLAAFAAMKALSVRNDAPHAASRPFDRDRDGFILGEGAGILVFESLDHARRRGAPIFAEVLGFGASTDATHITQPSEDGAGAAAAMHACLADARVNADQIDYVNAHGTSTPLGDLAETMAIKRTFGPQAKRLAISSTKSSIGHLLGASGGVELITSILAIRNSTAPPTLNLENPSEGCDLDYVPQNPRDLQISRALSNSFGFGGHNASLMVGRFE